MITRTLTTDAGTLSFGYNSEGLTIKDLKEMVKDLPEQDSDGRSFQVLIETGEYVLNLSKLISVVSEGDIIISSYRALETKDHE